tara:strand:+ start:424 stop:792 length:369 start_codon:yes stop_codon:yes gene_type:complete
MKDTIIIYSVHDKVSRQFVDLYGNKNDVIVLEDDGYSVRLKYPYISAFPTVIINTPSYTESFIIDEGGGGAFVNLDSIGSETIVPGDVEYIRAPNDWNEVQQRIDYWENKVPNWKKTDSRYL